MKEGFSQKRAYQELKKGYSKAERLLKDDAKMEAFLEKVDKHLKWIPFVRDELKLIPILISMLRSYMKKEYKHVPVKTLVAIVSALIYFLSPLDLVPDWIPFLGQLDDAAVIAICWKLVNKDVDHYRKWRKERASHKG